MAATTQYHMRDIARAKSLSCYLVRICNPAIGSAPPAYHAARVGAKVTLCGRRLLGRSIVQSVECEDALAAGCAPCLQCINTMRRLP